MMTEQQPISMIQKSELPSKASEMFSRGYRLVYVCCTPGDPLEITYSFDKDYQLAAFRIQVPRAQAVIPSITGSYLCALTYENEMQDLFGIKVENLAVDFKGNFYKLQVKTPYKDAGPAQPKSDTGAQQK
jgi:Ni,Fe-hydrogenase III component G